MSPPLPLRFVVSADDARKLPDTRAEVAVVGRSNVGKSSLLNALANRKDLARTSKTPGRTRLLNCFEVDGATIVDNDWGRDFEVADPDGNRIRVCTPPVGS